MYNSHKLQLSGCDCRSDSEAIFHFSQPDTTVTQLLCVHMPLILQLLKMLDVLYIQ